MKIILLITIITILIAYIVAIILIKFVKPNYDKPIDRKFLLISLGKKQKNFGNKDEYILENLTNLECKNRVIEICNLLQEISGEDFISRIMVADFIENSLRRQKTFMGKFTKLLLGDLIKQGEKYTKKTKHIKEDI